MILGIQKYITTADYLLVVFGNSTSHSKQLTICFSGSGDSKSHNQTTGNFVCDSGNSKSHKQTQPIGSFMVSGISKSHKYNNWLFFFVPPRAQNHVNKTQLNFHCSNFGDSKSHNKQLIPVYVVSGIVFTTT